MECLDLTLPTPEENLAADEVLWAAVEAGGPEVLRFWESSTPFVVLGYANRAEREVDLAACRARGVPVLRRCTGGGTVLQGPGCLNYTLALRIEERGPTAGIPGTNLWILNRHANALAALTGQPVRRRGETDLAIGERKFSGNAQRRGRRALLFHGTVLLDLDLALVEAVLPAPSRAPDYRGGRAHADFLMNLHLPATAVKEALRRVWDAATPGVAPPPARLAELVARRYGRREWTFRF